MSEIKHKLTSQGHFTSDRGTVFMVISPVTCPRSHAIDVLGSVVEIDGRRYHLAGVESWALHRPIITGEPLGLLVEPEKEKRHG